MIKERSNKVNRPKKLSDNVEEHNNEKTRKQG